MKKFIYLITLVILSSACSDYQKALKSDDVELKAAAATKQFEKGKYNKAIRIFEQVGPAYKGKPQAEKLFFMFAESYYKTKQYYLAGYQYESFASSYPKSEKHEEASFLGAKCFSMLSPIYSLDQKDTDKAIDKLQSFIDRYPDSSFLTEANAIMKGLKTKLEKKSFETAKQYNMTYDFKSAIIALDNFISDFPGTAYKEDALYYKFDSEYNLAINSVPSKMEERLKSAKSGYSNLMKFNASTKYKSKADEMLAKIDTDLKQFSK